MTLLKGFDPVISENCRVLLLGSMPGVASLQKHQYYAHPRNAFWSIMEELFAIDRCAEYAERCSMLSSQKIALWDVLKTCKREGSLDSRIQANSEFPNDFDRLFSAHHSINAVFFNGGTAERLYKKHILGPGLVQDRGLFYCRLPSTSPAYAAMSFNEKLEQWHRIFEHLTD